jgi:lysine-N-methylase
MKIETADFYDAFFCLADACPDTCCANWKIPIDSQTQMRYKTMPGELGVRARHALHRGCFRNKHGRCPFLREDGLCELIAADSSQANVSQVCRTYPRKIQTYGAYRQISLSVSCPQAAYLTLRHTDGFSFCTRDAQEPVECNTIDAATFAMLLALRRDCIDCLRNTEGSLRQRVVRMLRIADIQPRKIEEAVRRRRLVGCMAHLETNNPDAAQWMRKPKKHDISDSYCQQMQALVRAYPQIWSDLENLLVYAIDRYLLEAAEDADAASRIRLCILWCWMLLELDLCFFLEKGYFSQAEQIRLLTMFARQTEHSQRNLRRLLRAGARIV